MDYKNILSTTMISDGNIDYIVELISKNFKINQKAIHKCKNMITDNIKKYLNGITSYPKNNDELIYAIKYLNEISYNDFSTYLFNKYPGINITRDSYQPEPKQVEMTILTESEKNELLKLESPNLMNINTLQLLATIINIKQATSKNYVFDKIYNEDEVKYILANDNPQKLDISNGLTKEALPLVTERINELIKLKNNTDDRDEIEKIDREKKDILNAVITYKKDTEKIINENKNKIKNVIITATNQDDDENVEILDLKIDPTDNYNDLKNIMIKSKTDRKIVEIILVTYFLPYNENNITRFNNKFVVYYNNKLFTIIIPPMKYDIHTLINYIKSQATFLDFTIGENNIITMCNTQEIKFDLMIDDNTIFQTLGFTEKISKYKDSVSYTGSSSYNINSNDKVLFSLSGTPMVPMLMEFDKNITSDKILRNTKNGINIKQLKMNFMDSNDQYYDFTGPFNICIKIKYLS